MLDEFDELNQIWVDDAYGKNPCRGSCDPVLNNIFNVNGNDRRYVMSSQKFEVYKTTLYGYAMDSKKTCTA